MNEDKLMDFMDRFTRVLVWVAGIGTFVWIVIPVLWAILKGV